MHCPSCGFENPAGASSVSSVEEQVGTHSPACNLLFCICPSIFWWLFWWLLAIKIERFPSYYNVSRKAAKHRADHVNLHTRRIFVIQWLVNGIQEVEGSIPFGSTSPPLTSDDSAALSLVVGKRRIAAGKAAAASPAALLSSCSFPYLSTDRS